MAQEHAQNGPSGAEQDELRRALASCRQGVLDGLQRAFATCGTEVDQASRCASLIVEQAQSQADELANIARRIDANAGGRANLGSGLKAQTKLTRKFLGNLRETLRAQHDAARDAASRTQTISELATRVCKIARQAQVASMNADIQAVLRGNEGSALRVITRALGELSREVNHSNAMIAGAAAELVQLLPQMADSARSLHTRGEDFAVSFSEKLNTTNNRWNDITRSLRMAVQRSSARASRVVNLSETAHLSLQFHDAMDSRLSSIDSLLRLEGEPGQQASAEPSESNEAKSATGNQAVCDEIDRRGERVMEWISSVADLSGKAVYKAGQSLSQIVEEARAQSAELDKIAPRLDPSMAVEGNVGESFELQNAAMATFLTDLMSELAEQGRIAGQAVTCTEAIVRLASQVFEFAQRAQVLTAVAKIEEARLGLGQSPTVVTESIGSLRNEVRLANASIAETAAQLAEAVPSLARVVGTIRLQSESFVRQFSAQQQEIRSRWSELLADVSGAVRRSNGRANQVLKLSFEAISHLQFQDVMAQDMQRLARFFQEAKPLVVSSDGREHALAVEQEKSIKQEEESDTGQSLESGEVLLF